MNRAHTETLFLQPEVRLRNEKGPECSKNDHQNAAGCSNREVKDEGIGQASECW
jgi:hypothetical protein